MTVFEMYQRFGIGDTFGQRTYWHNGRQVTDNHMGIDMPTPEWTPVHAHIDGVLKLSGNYAGEFILNLEALDGSQNWTLGHCAGVTHKPGSKVKAGDHIGWTGNTGNSTAPHAHWERDEGRFKGSITKNHQAGTTTDPLPYIAQGGANDMTREESFQRVFIAIAQRWPNQSELDAWKKSGMEDYTWVQQNASNPAVDQERINAFHACFITLATRWPTQKEVDAWLKSGLSAYEWVQKNSINPIVEIKEEEVRKLNIQLETCEKSHGAPQTPQDTADLKSGRAFRSAVESIQKGGG